MHLGPAHLEACHLGGDGGAEIGCGGTAHGVEMRSGFGERRLGGIDGGEGGPFALSPALDRGDDLLGGRLACEDALHIGSEAPQQALKGRVARLHARELRLVDIHAVAVAPQIAGDILDRREGVVERGGE